MSTFSLKISVAAVSLGILTLSSCSGPVSAKAGSPEFYWAAARDSYAGGDYAKTVEHLDHLTDTPNDFRARAIPWSLVLESGMAAGYIELAEGYSAGARTKSANGPAFRRKASEYRGLASPLLLQAARTVEKLDQLPPGSILLAFGRPRGSLVPSAVLYRIIAGMSVTPTEMEVAPGLAVERNVLLAACAAAGAPNDSAKAGELLSHASTITARAAFASAMADMLDKASSLYSRDALDYPDKLATLQQKVRTLRAMADNPGPAMVVKVQAAR